ncbi:melanoma-associated antigen B10 [Erinaceus europaeus]|uniref:Melanoma-associated antigen B10 n=1 Tax=Erinaceus europaeus TaxID=9365 RepID=A0A1S3W737_ERIEU|nr:melanoma-associated antigen B10 [Erinaceus europaeus]
MPRGQKSKLRAREKRRQAQEESRDQDLQLAPYTTTSDAAVPYMEFDEGASNLEEEFPDVAFTEPFYRSPMDDKVVMLVHYLLYKYQMKEPVTKVDMLRNPIQVLKNQYHEILKRASEYLELIFGLDLKEVDPNRHIYVLVNKMELSHNSGPNDDRHVPSTGLLMTILGVIFTKGNSATEEQVWQILNAIGLYEEKEHFVFGDIRKLVTKDLVQEQYLEYRLVPNSDPPCYEFLWGPRAYAEITKTKVSEFLGKVHDTIPSSFPSWYEEAMRDEEERVQTHAAAEAHTTAVASARSK